jgi:hypothetical protein
MNLFEILSNDAFIIVYSSEDENMIITWNKSCTLQSWGQCKRAKSGSDDEWFEINARVLNEAPKGYKKARKRALAWIEYSGGY